jgi:hypothetical protein
VIGLLILLAFIAGMGASAFVMLMAAADTDRRADQGDWFEDVDQALLIVSDPAPMLRSVEHSKGRV